MAHLIGFRSGACAVLLSAAAVAVSGCSTAEAPPPLTRYDEAAIAVGRGPLDTGAFPNLNVPQQAAAAQFTDEERDAKLAALRAEQQRQAPGGTETPAQRRRRLQLLAAEQEDTLKVIEGN